MLMFYCVIAFIIVNILFFPQLGPPLCSSRWGPGSPLYCGEVGSSTVRLHSAGYVAIYRGRKPQILLFPSTNFFARFLMFICIGWRHGRWNRGPEVVCGSGRRKWVNFSFFLIIILLLYDYFLVYSTYYIMH